MQHDTLVYPRMIALIKVEAEVLYSFLLTLFQSQVNILVDVRADQGQSSLIEVVLDEQIQVAVEIHTMSPWQHP